jgi:hypothetical protein
VRLWTTAHSYASVVRLFEIVTCGCCLVLCSGGRQICDPVNTDDHKLFSNVPSNSPDVRIAAQVHDSVSTNMFGKVSNLMDDAIVTTTTVATGISEIGADSGSKGKKRGLGRIKCHGRCVRWVARRRAFTCELAPACRLESESLNHWPVAGWL